MKVGVAKETAPGERRVALVPEALGRLTAAGLEILVESGAGAGALIPDRAYADAGATVVSSGELYGQSDVILRVQKPSESEIRIMRAGQAVIGFLSPLIDPKSAEALAKQGVTAISLDAIPRTLSRAQSMDALSSQANVGGYKAVLIAANAFGRYFPLLTTAAGTAKPANVLILGIGVAGLLVGVLRQEHLGAPSRDGQGGGPQPRLRGRGDEGDGDHQGRCGRGRRREEAARAGAGARGSLGASRRPGMTAAQLNDLLTALTIFTLAILVGIAVISKVPATLHTPLMS